MLLEDRDPARVPVPAQPLADDRRPDGPILGQQRGDPVGERVETGAGRDPDVSRRLPQGEQPVGDVAVHTQPSGDGSLGHPFAMEEPMILGPVLHLAHSFLLVTSSRSLEGASRPGQGVLSVGAASTP